MSTKETIRVLLVEHDPTDVKRLRRAFVGLGEAKFELSMVGTLAEALESLRSKRYDIVLLTLELPDSSGVETFARIHGQAPYLPVLVLAASDDEFLAAQAVEQGAQDYLVKQQIGSPLLTRSIRYAIERSRLLQQLAAKRQREQQEREFSGIDRLSQPPGTSVTARMFSGGALRETAAEQFEMLVRRYMQVLDHALERRCFRIENNGADGLQDIADDLGFLRATPRDVVDVHSTALKKKVENVPWQKAQAYLQEGRLTVLELMGHLTAHYRNYYPARNPKTPTT